jgi:hypothetical protein
MKELIRDSLRGETNEHYEQNEFDLIGPDGRIILAQSLGIRDTVGLECNNANVAGAYFYS